MGMKINNNIDGYESKESRAMKVNNTWDGYESK